jgi:GNAT superfamily N-acetyltransferase
MVDHVRAVAESDAVAVAELLGQLGYSADPVATRDRLARWAADESSAALVWEDGGEVLGVIAVHVCPWFEKDGNWARIVALVVAETARGRGVGRELMSAVERFARQHGCRAVEVSSRSTRTDAHAFYRRLGFVDHCAISARFYRELA